MNQSVRWMFSLALLSAAACVGCGGKPDRPALNSVTGKVIVNGTPAPDVEIVFEPQGNGMVGNSSMAVTDASGEYKLKYKGGSETGAVEGKHIVRITRNAGGGPAGGATGAVVDTPIPPSYNTESTLTYEVTNGDNVKDFEVTTN